MEKKTISRDALGVHENPLGFNFLIVIHTIKALGIHFVVGWNAVSLHRCVILYWWTRILHRIQPATKWVDCIVEMGRRQSNCQIPKSYGGVPMSSQIRNMYKKKSLSWLLPYNEKIPQKSWSRYKLHCVMDCRELNEHTDALTINADVYASKLSDITKNSMFLCWTLMPVIYKCTFTIRSNYAR